MYFVNDGVEAAVADIGSHAARIGFAGDDTPKAYLPSSIGTTTSMDTRHCHFDVASNFREDMEVDSMFRQGLIEDWNLLENLWTYSLNTYLKCDSKEVPVLIAEKPFNTPACRYKLTELMFEKFDAPAMFLSNDAVLSCYACGRTNGIVVDIGASGTVVSPICDGWLDSRGMNRSAIGGRFLDLFTNSLLKCRLGGIQPLPKFRIIKSFCHEAGLSVKINENVQNVHSSYDAFTRLEIGRGIKEATCKVAESTLMDCDPRYSSIPTCPYELPDGTSIDLGIERFQIPELLFTTPYSDVDCQDLTMLHSYDADLHQKSEGLPSLITKSVLSCDNDMQTTLMSNIIVTGGSSSFDGISDRIKNEVERIVHSAAPTLKVKTVASATNERALCPWIGGSILASLGSFHEMWMSRQEYLEFGSSLIDRKCP